MKILFIIIWFCEFWIELFYYFLFFCIILLFYYFTHFSKKKKKASISCPGTFALSVSNTNLTIDRITITKCTQSGLFLFLNFHSCLFFVHVCSFVYFLNANTAVIVNQNAQITILYSVLSNNAGTSGGALFVDQGATAFIQETQFISNKAQNGGLWKKFRMNENKTWMNENKTWINNRSCLFLCFINNYFYWRRSSQFEFCCSFGWWSLFW